MKVKINKIILIFFCLLTWANPCTQKQNFDLLLSKLNGFHHLKINIFQTGNKDTINTIGTSNFFKEFEKNSVREDFQFDINEEHIFGTTYLNFSEAYNRYELIQVDSRSKSTLVMYGQWDENNLYSITFKCSGTLPQWGLPMDIEMQWKYKFIDECTFIKEIWFTKNQVNFLNSTYLYTNNKPTTIEKDWNKCQIDLHDGKIAFEITGKGPSILIINGGPGWSSYHIKPFAEKIASKGFQVIIFDQRGTGESRFFSEDSSTITFNNIVDDVERIRTHLKISQWTIIGHSFGSMVAMDYAVKFQNYITKLVLMAPGGGNLNFLEYYQQNINSKLSPQNLKSIGEWTKNSEEFSKTASINIIYNTLPAFLYNDDLVNSVMKYVDENTWDIQSSTLIWENLYKSNFDVTNELKKISKKVLILQGKQDPLGDLLAMDNKNNFKNANLKLLNECGHILWVDQPEIVLSEVTNFLVKE